MFVAALANIATICIGVVLLWGWVAFIAEAIARRTGRKRAVPYPDEVLWALFGRSLLDLGLFGGESVWTERPGRALAPRGPKGGEETGGGKPDQTGSTSGTAAQAGGEE